MANCVQQLVWRSLRLNSKTQKMKKVIILGQGTTGKKLAEQCAIQNVVLRSEQLVCLSYGSCYRPEKMQHEEECGKYCEFYKAK